MQGPGERQFRRGGPALLRLAFGFGYQAQPVGGRVRYAGTASAHGAVAAFAK